MDVLEYVVYEKSNEKVYFSRRKERMSLHLTMALKIVIRLVTVSVSYLILHQEFHLIKIYHVKYISKLPHTSSRVLCD